MRYLTAVTAGLLLLGCAPPVGELRDQAISQYQLGYLDEAEESFREVLNKRPYDPESLYHMGRIMHSKGRLVRAIYYYQSCLDVQPSHQMARMWLRRAEQQAGDSARHLRFIPPDEAENGR